MPLRPLNRDGTPKRESQLTDGERRSLKRENEAGRNLRTERGDRGLRGRREK